MTAPFFSIIVVSFNAEETIRRTVESVLSQSFEDYEIIVKDAASTDGTLAKIPQSEKIRVFVNADSGIYDGMNEALGYATGKYVQFLNCGDVLADWDVLKTVHAALTEKETDVIYGNIRKFGKLNKQIKKPTRRALCRTTICHQAIFYKRELFELVGKYDTSYSLCADREHLLRLHQAKKSFRFIKTVICEYLGNGASEAKANADTMRKEDERIQKAYFTEREQKRCQRERQLRNFIKRLLRPSRKG